MGGVKLIVTNLSLFCARVEWALKLKGVDYEIIEEDLRNKSPILLKYNPVHKKVPVIVHHDTAIAESLVILEYIDETWKESPLLPEDPYERAQARFLAKYADEKVVIGVWTACKEEEGEQKVKAIEAALESLAHLEKFLEGKKFFGGEQIGYLDLVVGWIPHWLNVMEEVGGMKILEAERFPCLLTWSQNFIHTPLIKECIPHRENLVEYMSASLGYFRSLSAKKVPVLVHHDTPIAESLVILEYIDETWKESPLLPKDPYERAEARFWAKFADEKVVIGAITACTAAEGEDKEKAVAAALESLAHLEKLIQGKKFFGGEQIRYLDLVVGWLPHWLNVMEEIGSMKLLEAERFPCLIEWGQNFIHTPLIKECIPHRERVVENLSPYVSYLHSLSANKA